MFNYVAGKGYGIFLTSILVPYIASDKLIINGRGNKIQRAVHSSTVTQPAFTFGVFINSQDSGAK